jgi:hypothetical protein
MKKLVLLFTLIVTMFTAQARKFYWSSTGNDSYTSTQAQNQATPWQTLRKLTSMATGTNGSITFRAGDTLCFKRGDIFYGNPNDSYCAAYYWNDGGTYFTAPSGVPGNPIVFTNYGDPNLSLPNWLHPRAYYPVSSWPYAREGRGIIEFAGVHDIVVDGIQSNDFRVPEIDKQNPGYSGGWIVGEWTRGTSGGLRNSYNDTTRRKSMVTRFVIKNCKFNNTMYGIQCFAGIDSKITNCTFTNFKSSADTAGVNDVLACAIEAVNGIRCEFSYNYIKGAWAKSGRISSTNGLGGVAFDIFNLYNSRIAYNTIIDCSGAFEIGNLDLYDTSAGCQYDTFAFNKIINTSQFAYFHGTGTFAGNNHHVSFWNNILISNNKDRMIGAGFGADIYGDGQGWRPGTQQPWWFCRNPFSTFNPPNYPLAPTTTTTAGSNIVTVSNATGITIGTVAFIQNDSLLGRNYQTITVTNISGNQITLSASATQTRTTTNINYYLPINDQTWSNPQNSAYSNYGGTRSVIQYSTDATVNGSGIDTMFDSRNNIIYWTTGVQGVYDRTRYKRSNNIYSPIGGARYSTTLGGTLKTGEKIIVTKIFRDTSSSYPEDWDLHLVDTSYGMTNSLPTPGFTVDFEGSLIIGKPSIGLYAQYRVVLIDTCTFTYGQWSICNNGYQTRTYSINQIGCQGTPPRDSIRRICINPTVISFYYNSNRRAIWINTTRPGSMAITNTAGSITRNINYSAGGQWISVNRYSAGIYFASTFGQGITFMR